MKAQEAIKRIKEFGLYHAIGDYYYSDKITVNPSDGSVASYGVKLTGNVKSEVYVKFHPL